MSLKRAPLELNPEVDQPKVTIICFDISNFSQNAQFSICTIAVFVFFLLYGYMQELIFTVGGSDSFGWYLTLVQFACYSIFGGIETTARNLKTRKIPFKTYLLLAMLTLGTMGFSNSSLGYLNYPTQVIFKCCKLIPVMIGSILIQGKRYGPLDFLAAFLMCFGLTMFTLADMKLSPIFNTHGVFLISMALLCDAIIGNVQEKSIKAYGATNSEVVLYSYFIGFIYLFVIMLLSGDLSEGFDSFAQNPRKLYTYTLIFSLTGYLGIQIVLTLVRTCGAFAAVTVTTCRKAVTIIMSFVFFNKPFTMQYLWSGVVVVLGIYINLYNKKNNVSFIDIKEKLRLAYQKSNVLKADSRRYKHYTADV